MVGGEMIEPPAPPAPRATILDVARTAGVSKATVSRVLNGSASVTDSTRERVERAVDEVGFSISWQARSLARGRSECVGVVVSEPFADLWTDPTFTAVLQGIYDALEPTAYVPLLIQADTENQQSKARTLISRSLLDAAIHVSPYIDHGLLAALEDAQVPTVLCGQPTGEAWSPVFASVYADDVVGGRLAAAHLRDRGRSRPVAILGPSGNPATRDRLRGYREVFESLTGDRCLEGGWDTSSGIRATRALLRSGVAFDSILCASDRMAVGVLQVLEENGLSVPGDVAVVGFDDHPLAATASVPLTTVAQPMHDEGTTAVRLAHRLVEGAPARTEILSMRLVVRDSA